MLAPNLLRVSCALNHGTCMVGEQNEQVSKNRIANTLLWMSFSNSS